MRRADSAIRAVALLSPDKMAQEALLLAIGEIPEEAREAMTCSSWNTAFESGFLQLEMALMTSTSWVDRDAVENFAIRAVALMTNHEPVRACLLYILAETPEVARQQLAGSCWSECLSSDVALQRANLAREFGLSAVM
jgi:hypothetical protein